METKIYAVGVLIILVSVSAVTFDIITSDNGATPSPPPSICRLYIKVVGIDDNTAVSDAIVTFKNADQSIISTETTLANGTTWLDLYPGVYTVTVSKNEYSLETKTINLQMNTTVVIELKYTHEYLVVTYPTYAYQPDDGLDSDIMDIKATVKGKYYPGKKTINNLKFYWTDYPDAVCWADAHSDWTGYVYVGVVPPGLHELTIQGFNGRNLVCTVTKTVEIPQTWDVYFSTEGLADEGQGIYRVAPWCEMNAPFDGKMVRIRGEFYLDLLGNQPCEVWVNLWNLQTGNWQTVYKVKNPQEGWNTVDIVFDGVYTDWWGFAGCRFSGSNQPYNAVTEWRGYTTMIAGSKGMYETSIWQSILNWFNGVGDKNNPPAPCSH